MLSGEPGEVSRPKCPGLKARRRAYIAQVEAIEPRLMLDAATPVPEKNSSLNRLSEVRNAERTYPYTAIVRITSKFADGHVVFGTGFMVGPFHVLTSAHLLERPGGVSEVSVAPGQNGRKPSLKWRTATMLAFHSYREAKTNHDYKDDLALLVINRNIGQYTGWFQIAQSGENLAYIYDNWTKVEKPVDVEKYKKASAVFVAGYPGSVPGLPGARGRVFLTKTNIEEATSSGFFRTSAPTQSGMSGSPVWYSNGQSFAQRKVLGIVSLEGGLTTLLTRERRAKIVLQMQDDILMAIDGKLKSKIRGIFGTPDKDFPKNHKLAPLSLITPNI